MRMVQRLFLALLLLAIPGGSLLAQGMPIKQPNRLMIFVESLKPGTDTDHAVNESGWPAAYARANSPYYYLALSSMTGPSEVWFVSPYDSYAAEAKQMKTEGDDAALNAEFDRLARADAQYLSDTQSFEAIARPDLSYGQFPDLGLARFFGVTLLRIRMGHGDAFEAAAKVYMTNFKRANPSGSYRMYQVINGMPGVNYLVFSTVNDYAALDAAMAADNAMFQGMNPKDMAMLQKSMTDDFQNIISNRYRLSPSMSYVSAETKAKDPAFWNKH